MDQAGKLLQQRYRIERQIGQGGMGAVYIAVDERFGSTVAIKQTLCMDDNYRKAIEREARLLNSLKHAALPRVSDHFVEDDGQYLVMEYVPGEDLCCILEERGEPFSAEQVLEWADQLLDALEFLHSQSNPVIHRDIKPQNLKVMPNGQIILLDFGLAKGNPTDAKNATASKSIFGYSRNYASLEQIQGTGTDPRSDLYSLAATLYHLVTGVPPEDALTRAMAVLTNQPDPLTPAHAINDAVPTGLSAILTQTLDLNAANRPASAAEMRRTLRAHESFAGAAQAAVGYSGRATAASALYEQKTRLMSDDTSVIDPDSTEVSGKGVAPASQVTRFREPGGKTANRSGRGLLLPVLGLGGLLLAGAAVGGVIYYESAVGEGPGTVQEAVPPVTATVADSSANSGDAPAAANEVAEKPATAAATRQGQAPDRKRPQSDQAGAGETVVIDENGERIVIKGDTIYSGNIKVSPNGIEGPDGVVDLRDPRPLPPGVEPPPDVFRSLTPEQRRRIREAIRRSANVNVPRPTPPPN